jgi:E3 ubiquitin-protein ligase HUWE1
LHRATIWENIVMKSGLAEQGLNATPSNPGSPGPEPPTITPVPVANAQLGATFTNGGTPAELTPSPAPGNSQSSPKEDATKMERPRERNITAIKHITHGLPATLAPFFGGESS